VIDVREPHEWDIVHLDGARLIPLASLPAHLHEYDRSAEIVVHCKSGARSAKATQLLKDAGFRNVKNLEGGILRWARDVDPSLPTY
jgi:adenylyltransferase/sulfurtransferase